MNQQRLGEIKKHLQVLVSTFGSLVESERTANILGECIIELDRLTAENAELRAEVERLGEQLGKMKYPETSFTGPGR